MEDNQISAAVFVASLLLTFALAFIGRRATKTVDEQDLGDKSLNRWLVGLSAGATANSGFVVTGAVGLGYIYGLQWTMLPAAWFLGDLVFWRWFPHRINEFGRKTHAVTVSELLRHGITDRWGTAFSLLAAVLIVAGLSGYTAAQWLAGQKFLEGAFGFSEQSSLLIFALLIIGYSSIGGFRGSVYADTFQAVIRVLGTVLVLATASWLAFSDPSGFQANIGTTDETFFDFFPNATLFSAVGFMAGWAAAALGFGLGQPQVLARYLASRSPEETHAARWIYIGYVQLTWLSMTVFGLLLRGLMPDIEDPETGLSLFVQAYMFPVVTGVIVADIFGAIASTANSLLVSIAHSIKRDFLGALFSGAVQRVSLGLTTLAAGLATMALSAVVGGSVVSLALSSVSIVGAGLAVPVMIKVMGWRHSGASLTFAIAMGILSALIWVRMGYSQYLNEAAIGMIASFITNWLISRLGRARSDALSGAS